MPHKGMPFILQYQRCVTVTRWIEAGYFVRSENTMPPLPPEFGPIPREHLRLGWQGVPA